MQARSAVQGGGARSIWVRLESIVAKKGLQVVFMRVAKLHAQLF
jgi:hypothetical protein